MFSTLFFNFQRAYRGPQPNRRSQGPPTTSEVPQRIYTAARGGLPPPSLISPSNFDQNPSNRRSRPGSRARKSKKNSLFQQKNFSPAFSTPNPLRNPRRDPGTRRSNFGLPDPFSPLGVLHDFDPRYAQEAVTGPQGRRNQVPGPLGPPPAHPPPAYEGASSNHFSHFLPPPRQVPHLGDRVQSAA